MSIVFYLGYAKLTTDNYGSELALLNLAKEFAKTQKVYILSDYVSGYPELTFISRDDYLKNRFDVLIISRYINFYLYLPVRADKVFIWIHDVCLQSAYEGRNLPDNGRWLLENVAYDGIIVQTEWHRRYFSSLYPDSDDKISIIGNGIPTKLFKDPIKKIPFRFIYTSSPKRGLDTLLEYFPDIRKLYPESELYIYRGIEEFTQRQIESIRDKSEYIKYMGKLSNADLIEKFKESDIWFYPTHFAETFCISAVEAQAAGCLCVCSSFAALTEIIGDRGVLLNFDNYGKPEFKQEALDGLTRVVEYRENYQKKAIAYGLSQDWSERCLKWLKLMDIPKLSFEKILSVQGNWTNTLSLEWKKLVPPEYPFTIVDTPTSNTIIFNGVCYRGPQEGDICLKMEPDCNQGHIPPMWQHSRKTLPRNMIEWHLSSTFQELSQSSPEKTKELSAIISGENRLPGHKKRLELIQYLDKHLSYDLYGRGKHNLRNYKGPLSTKDNGIFPYKYHIAIESCQEKDYWTEKLADPLLGECLCFYWGCPNISEYIDDRAIILLPDTPEDCLKTIINAINLNEYEKRLPYIRNEKKRVLEWSIFPTMKRLLSGEELMGTFPTLILNLERRQDRWFEMTRKMAGMVYQRVEAVDGNKIEPCGELFSIFCNKKYPQKNPHMYQGLSKSIMGCALSHIEMWNKVLESNTPYLILEDDIILEKDFNIRWISVAKILRENPDWDLCYLGYLDDKQIYDDPLIYTIFKGEDTVETEIFQFNPHSTRTHGGGTHSYCISPRGAKKLLQLVKKFGVPQPIDWFMIEMFSYLKAFKCLPHLIEPIQTGDSDIWPDRVGFEIKKC